MPKTLQSRGGGRGAYGNDRIADILNKPGVFMTIPVVDLKIDSEYQRSLTGHRVDRIKDNWSWIACGVITVALRGSGSGNYFVVDGQHRVAAAERANIAELPCLVFESLSHVDEAKGFIDVNTSRKAMSVVDKYRALLVVEDPVALHVRGLLELANRSPDYTGGSGNDGRAIRCLDYLMTAVAIDAKVLDDLWPLVIDVCEGRLITKKLVQGMFYIERFLTNTSLLDRHWRRRILQVGYDGITKSIDETAAFEGRSGAAVCANGVLRALNRGLRNKLVIEVKEGKPNAQEERP